jgi:hypothetical protein
MSKVRLLAIALSALATALTLQGLLRFVEWARPVTLAIVMPGGNVTPAERALRPIYPYSVIPGGAYSPSELRYSVANDRIVRDHYSDFHLESARLVTLTADRYQYVSFRIRDKVYWTRRKIRIPKGEILLTDGVHFARTRCGNRLCNTSQALTTFAQPSLKTLALPPFTSQLLAKGQVALPPAPPLGELAEAGPGLDFGLPRLAPYLPPNGAMPGNDVENWPPVNVVPPPGPIMPGYPVVPVLPNNPISPTPPTVPAEVPEPASIYLFVAALAASLWLITRWMRGDRNSHTDSTDITADVTKDGS